MLYDQSAVFSDHDLLLIVYDHHINIKQEDYEYRYFKGVNYNLLQQLKSINWNQTYTYNYVNDQMRFLQENFYMKQMYL